MDGPVEPGHDNRVCRERANFFTRSNVCLLEEGWGEGGFPLRTSIALDDTGQDRADEVSHQAMVNAGMVNRGGFEYVPAAKIAIFARLHQQIATPKSPLNIFPLRG